LFFQDKWAKCPFCFVAYQFLPHPAIHYLSKWVWQMVYSPKLWKLPVKPVYTPAGEYLINWMPKLNNYYEPTKNPTKNGAIGVSISSTTEPRPSEAHNKLRTSKNTDSMPRIALSTSDSRHLLRGQDSNLEPSPYT